MCCIASPAPNGWTRCTDKQAVILVGAGLLAKNVNDNAQGLIPSGVSGFFASMLAPTVENRR
ncbi:hypothetical protein FIV38_18960 [Pseudomonas proteolytica]|nr:hypothetical protein F4W61_13895 [Pseudomonas proteolytica]QHG25794.1 hypothetical protein GDV60_24185 [Pseudomonas sp. DTU12.1]TWR79169.1 hypothetical protein FIV38_18960 [Pseudomonas proteolytica]